ncbi:MAG: DUF2178 domain-containing protein [Patescibacteria group bacterium]|jgi:uncharacterized membrane protein
MTLKQFQIVKLTIAALVAGTISYSITVDNYIVPMISIAFSIILLVYLRSRVKEVIADERDYEIGGHAARWAMMIFSWTAVIAMFLLYYEKALNPTFEVVAYVLAYAVCVLMLLYSLLFRYYDQIRFMKRRTYYIIAGVVLLIIVAIMGLRFFSGEDTWMCQNGQWVEHGHPSASMPTTNCQK